MREIKEEVKEEVHLLPEMQQLYHEGALLEDGRTAASYGIRAGSTLKVIGMRPSSVPLHPSQARLLATFMDRSSTAKADSRKEARKRAMRYHAKKQQELELEAALQLAVDCGQRWAAADMPLRFRMRSRLLQAGYVEDPTVDEDLQQVLKQRDYLIQRQAGLIKKNGAMVDGFIEELSNMCGIEQGAAATVSTYDAALVREASVVRGQIEPTLAVGADVVRGLREETAAAVAKMGRAKEESEVLRYEQYKWKSAKRSLEFDLRQLQLTVRHSHSHSCCAVLRCAVLCCAESIVLCCAVQLDTVSEELLHVRKQVRSTAPDYKAVKEMFSAMDHDGSGRLEPHEVKGLCAQLRTLVPVELSEAEMAAAVRRMDRDGDGDVDFNECEQCFDRRRHILFCSV